MHRPAVRSLLLPKILLSDVPHLSNRETLANTPRSYTNNKYGLGPTSAHRFKCRGVLHPRSQYSLFDLISKPTQFPLLTRSLFPTDQAVQSRWRLRTCTFPVAFRDSTTTLSSYFFALCNQSSTSVEHVHCISLYGLLNSKS